MSTSNQYTTYSEFLNHGIDPCKDSEACLLRSGLIYSNNPAVIPQKYHKNGARTDDGAFVKKLYRCHLCSQQYATKDALSKHWNIRHLRENDNVEQLMVPRWYCPKCKKEFAHKMQSRISHFCVNGTETMDVKQPDHGEHGLRLCSIECKNDNERALFIKRIRYECRIENSVESIGQWLKYELVKRQLSQHDYVNAAKMFIAVKGYDAAINLLKHCKAKFTDVHAMDDQTTQLQDKLIRIAQHLRSQK